MLKTARDKYQDRVTTKMQEIINQNNLSSDLALPGVPAEWYDGTGVSESKEWSDAYTLLRNAGFFGRKYMR